MPQSLTGKLHVWRYMIYRRIVQFTCLLLFFGTFHWGWSILEQPVLSGNLSSSKFLGFIPLADPFATLQIFLTQHLLRSEVIIGAGIILFIYTLTGRAWCAWVCPVNMVTDLAGWFRKRLKIPDAFPLQRRIRYYILGLTLILSVITGVAAFEWVSPISMFHRGVIFGMGLGWTALLAIFIFDLLILKHGWCGHLCPLGAFYAVTGKAAQLRVSFDTPTCTHCCECVRVCPEPQVLNFKKAGEAGMISSGECTNCARCITVCPEDTLHFSLRHKITVKNSIERNAL
ncbi:MAG TPA: quinol dehydrogenase ferredoxin subunit NapH [Gammaproteobacteria bacterium]|nr:quinol dehydrogenase ferredoxin subunit NapH [Gammaproteobacteria bacterium]